MYFGDFVSKKESRNAATWLFLIGCFSMTQLKLGAKIGISEAGCLLAMPFIFIRDYAIYKRDGVSIYFNLLLLWLVGALFSDWYNHSRFEQVIRGFSVPLLVLACSVCIYHFLRRNPGNLKWLLFGIAVSSVISIFIFQRGSAGDLAAEGDMAGAVERVVGYKLFWSGMIKTWLNLPVQGWYLHVPFFYVLPALICVSGANSFAGGRSAFAVSVLSVFLVLIGGKKVQSMQRVRRYFPMMIIACMALAVVIKGAYSYAATHGYLNESETVKYEKQTAKGTGFLAMLMGGRGDFFIGLFAALDKPFVGNGSQALDTYGYERDFVSKYGTAEEEEQFAKRIQSGYLRTIRAHSHIICYWMWHGVTALMFWLYILWLIILTLWKRLSYIPEWFGYFAIVLPSFLWDYFFSPFGLRVDGCTLFCALLVLVRIERMKERGMML